MPELLTVAILVEQLKRLRLAFPSHQGMKTPEQTIATAEVYLDGLRGISADALRAATKTAIETEKFFPKIVDLRTLAAEWTRRHSAYSEPELKDPMWCPRCSSRIEWIGLWVPAIDARCRSIMQEFDGVLYVQLATTARYLCRCSAASMFAREPDLEGNWMRRDRITSCFGAQGVAAHGPGLAQLPPLLSDEARRRLEEGAESAREERARRGRGRAESDSRAPEHIGELAENMAAGVLEHV